MRFLKLLPIILFSVFAFNITKAQTITVTSPNGGQNWAGCTVQAITWTATGTSGFFSVDYSTNNGSTWTSLATNLNANSYSWTVPNTASSTSLVRVFDFNTPSTVDQSNAVFTITAPLILTAPNGGESWQVGGSTHNITWAASGTGTYLTLEYSIDAGANWITITTSATASSGTYIWTIPNNPSTNCLVRVKDNSSACMTDVSNNLFTIAPPTPIITVTSPNTALTRYVGNAYNITWTSAYLSSSFVKLEYSIDNGSSWTTITSSTNNTGSYSWTVPNTPSTLCLVRASDAGNSSTNDVSDVNFIIASPFITITSPNGGENFTGCSTQTITWTRGGTTNNAKIEYSTNGGSSWTVITSSYSAGSGTSCSYTWTGVPNTPSTTCLIRITDVTISAATDQSNSNFTISANSSIVVTAPNGGESWQVGGSTHVITWASSTGNNYFNLDYSIDGGLNWISIYNGYNTSTYNYTWTIPNNPSTNCLVRVSDYYNTCQNDQSNAVFTIAPPTPVITVTSPNTALTRYVGNSYNITWTSAYLSSSFVKLEYSIDNGSSWIIITGSTNNTGSYTWSVPNTPSTLCLVRASDFGNSSTNDVSDVNFIIASPFITVTSPNGGENFTGCSTQTITWTRGGTTNNAKIEYSTNGGSSWTVITSSYSAGSGTSCSYTWTGVPNTPSTTCLIRITDVTLSSATDQSNSNFTISANSSIVVTSPNGGESWQIGGSTHVITWASSTGNNYFNIDYSIDGGLNWISIYNGYNTSTYTYTWTIPNNPSTNCLVRVSDYYNTCQNDQSNAAFTIVPPTPVITVTSPNTALTRYVGNSYNITWTSAYLSSSFVKLEYSIDNGSSWIIITGSTNNTGSYTWSVPNTPSTLCLVRASDYGNSSTNDISDVNFIIASPFITVTSPNGGENFTGCSTQTITWTRGGTTNNAKIEYSTNGGGSWTVINSSYSAGSGTSCSYTWSGVPNTPSTTCLIRITDVTISAATDQSNSNFTISANSSIVLTSPNGGESWQVGGSTHIITWASSTGNNYFNLDYSIDGGLNWISIYNGYNTSTYTYTWTIPNNPSTNCLVRVSDYYNTCQNDQSNAVFTIAAPTPVITVTSPNTALTRYVGNSYNITWTSAYLSSSFVKLEYSIDNGSSWTTITSSTNNTGSYSWLVPNTPSTLCLVRASDAGNSSTNDVSDANFIIASPFITVTSPNGGENYTGCSTQTITWTRGGTTNNAKIEYSTNGGSSWTILNSSYSAGSGTNCSYTWSGVPNTPSTTCLVRITDVTISAATDQSNSNFTISANSSIVLTSPNGGESWQVGGSTHIITWASSTGNNYFNIDYSIDGGLNWISIYNGYNTSTYNYTWTIPNNPSTNCLVRVSDYYNTCQNDQSNAAFIIAAPTPVITVTSPNTGLTRYVGNSYNITWTSAYLSSSFVKLEYSIDNGSSWIIITGSTNNTGSYSWSVPNTPSTLCLVRASDFGNSSTNDVSDANFTIASPFITITSPNGGESYTGCSTQTITWTRGGTTNNAKIEYSINGGSSWTVINSSYSAGSGTSCSYTWSGVPNTPSTTCLIRITDVTISSATDQSNSNFTILSNSSIVVTSPNGGESWQVGGSTHVITWASSTGNNYFNIDYSIDGGLNWISIYNGYNTSTYTYTWTIPNNPSTNCLVRVSDYYNTCQNDQSNATFTIAPPTPVITVTSPNTAVTWYVASSYNITWTSAYISSSFVKLEYSINNGGSWISIVSATNNTGSYSWAIPNTPSAQCLVRVSDFGNPATNDISNTNFTIAPAITVSAPNGGENLGSCTSTSINWAAGGCSGNFKIEYSINGGSSWTIIVSSYTASGTGNDSYTWTLPNTPSTNCLVKVTDAGSSAKTDQSNSTFAISPAITITQPNFGGSYVVGSVLNINWTSTGLSNFYNIYYSIDGGSTWTVIVFNSNITTNTYAWTVPNFPSTNCMIKVTDNINTCKTDQSDVAFTITTTPPPITVTAPNGTENWQTCSSQTITWNATGTSGIYDLVYSTDGGSTWNTIITSYSAGGSSCSYLWTVPNTISSTCLVKITDTGFSTRVDQSNSAFIISGLTLTATGTATICNGSSTPLTASGTTSFNWAPSSGLSATNISNPVATPSTTTTYTVTGTTGSCSNTATVTITVNPVPTVSITGGGTICTGSSSTLMASGAITYSWLPATYLNSTTSSTVISTPTSTITYTVTGTTNGCSNTATSTITVNNIPTITISSASTICNGGSTSIIAGGAASYSWLPSTGLNSTTGSTVTASPAGTVTYTVTGTDNGCSNTATTTVTVTPVPTLSVAGITTICNGSSTSITASGATTYSWSPSTGLSATNIANPVASPTTTTTYTVTGTTSGCSSTTTVTITVNSIPSVSVTGAGLICAGNSVTLTASGGTTYSWLPATDLSSTTIANPVASPGSTTTYTVTGTTNGCSNTATALITVTPLPIVAVSGNMALCTGGSSTLTATGATTYSWSPATGLSATNIANPVATPTSTTTYTITGTTSGCSGTTTATVMVNPIPVVTATGSATICAGDSTTLTANGSNSYNWLPTTGLNNSTIFNPSAKPSSTTTYTVTGTSLGCSDTSTVSVTITSLPVIVISANTGICNGNSTTLTASGASTYSWLPTTNLSDATSATPIATPTVTTTYTVSGTNGACTGVASTTITVSAIPVVAITGTSVICDGSNTALTASGATSYSWLPTTGLSNPSIANPTASPTTTITYTVTGTTSGCSGTGNITITVNPSPTVTATGTATICSGASTSLNASGAGSFSWLPATGLSATNIANPVASPTTTTTYTVTGTTSGCSSTATVTITVTPLPTANAGPDANISCSGSTTLNATGGTSYSWLPATGLSATNIANPVASPSVTTTYTVTVTSGSCSATDSVIVSVSPVVANAGADVTICNGNSTTLSASGGTIYLWAPGTGLSATNIANPVASPTSTTSYTVTATTNSCSSTDIVIVTVNPLPPTPTITLSGSNLLSSASTNNQWYLGGTIIGGAVNQTYTPTASGNYTVVVTLNGCSSTSASYAFTLPVTYCIPNPTTGTTDGDFINGVVLGSINNINSGSTSGPNYTSYTSSMSTILKTDSVYSIAITNGTYATDNYAAWIDYNQDGDFIDAGEKLGEFATTSINQTQNIGFTVPSGAIVGTTTMRVRCVYGNTPISPCTSYTYGETEDYKIVMQTSSSTIPVANFTANNTTICAGASVAFSDLSTGTPTSWLWTFTGGTPSTSTLQNPSVVYNTSGSYNVTLVATNSFGSNTKNSLNYIVVVPLPPTPTITLSGSDLISSASANNQWYLNGTIIGGAVNQTYTPTASGNYTVMVTTNGCSSTSTAYVFTMPVTYCIPNPTTGTTDGDFINGVVLDSINNINSGSTTGPNYTDYTSSMSTTVTIDSAYSIAITNGTYATDNYAAWIDYNQDGDFIDAGEKLGEFATTSINQTQNIGFTVPSAANAGVTIMRVRCVYGNSPVDPCTNYGYGETEDYKIVIQTSESPVADFNANITTICTGSSVAFSDLSSGTPTSWAWTFTGGTPSSSNLQNPSVVYGTSGTYDVSLVATNSFGSATKNNLAYVVAVDGITADAGIDTSICIGNSINLAASGGSIYSWSPSTGLDATNIANPVANPTVTTTYSVTVSNGSCSSMDFVTITAKPLPSVSLAPMNNVCSDAPPFTLTGGSPAGGIYSGTGVSNDSILSPSVAGTGTFLITYSFIGSNGCSNSAASAVVISVCTDIAGGTSNDDIIVYPNPFNNYTIVKIADDISFNNASIMVFDLIGKRVMNIENITTHEIKLERNDLESGAYFYQFMNNNRILRAGKLMIE